MAIDWVALLITAGVGLGGGIISGVASSIFGKYRVNRAFATEQSNIQGTIEKLCNKAAEEFRIAVVKGKRNCFVCDESNPDQAVFCKYCGTPLKGAKMCSDCQIPLPDNAIFCYLCGEKSAYKDSIEELKPNDIEQEDELVMDEEPILEEQIDVENEDENK
ncbi:MAG: zinc ribbon domain-containing protein [Candidatus Heimdallarchaeota archaeon]|nr:zinc ribbon domain-containing protein [Candidatus Heimdallarchaeota archaeon]